MSRENSRQRSRMKRAGAVGNCRCGKPPQTRSGREREQIGGDCSFRIATQRNQTVAYETLRGSSVAGARHRPFTPQRGVQKARPETAGRLLTDGLALPTDRAKSRTLGQIPELARGPGHGIRRSPAAARLSISWVAVRGCIIRASTEATRSALHAMLDWNPEQLILTRSPSRRGGTREMVASSHAWIGGAR